MTAWLVIVAVGVGSFAMRAAPLFLIRRSALGGSADTIIRRAGIAAIAALIALSSQHSATTGQAAPTLVALAVAGVLAVRGASMMRLVVCGSAIYAAGAVVMGVLGR